MSLISYAQNFEDVILWRALNHVGRGFYVDVGAQDPIIDSVSLGFYEKGWRGVHVEPTSSYAEKLRAARSDEDVIQGAVGTSPDLINFWEFPNTGLSTGDPAIAAEHETRGFEGISYQVPSLRLSEILDRYADRDIHWLKIDVEGMEPDVIASWVPSPVRPWVVVIESTRPTSTEATFIEWEPAVFALGYDFVYFDGLNRFYVSHAHPELKSSFGPGPNVFDGAALSGLSSSPFPVKLSSENQELQRQVKEATEQLSALEVLRQEAVAQQATLSRHIGALHRSTSWRITTPLRLLSRGARRIAGQFRHRIVPKPGSSARRLARDVVTRAADLLAQHPRVARAIKGALRRFPRIEARLRLAVHFGRTNSSDEPAGALRRWIAERNSKGGVTKAPAGSSNEFAWGPRTLYVFVDHTVCCPVNTGVQRVTRGIARSLAEGETRVRFVKWDSDRQCCILINSRERQHLARWGGPPVTEEDLDVYPMESQAARLIDPAISGQGNWLIVPEVTHITPHSAPVTLDLILWARRAKMSVGFVFYDAIPLRRDEFAATAPLHSRYMQELRLADQIWSISDWSADDLVTFWSRRERASGNTMPPVTTIHLPGGFDGGRPVPEYDGAKRLILSVGTIEPRKNQVALMRAFKAYRTANPGSEWRLVLVGNLHPLAAQEFNSLLDESIEYVGNCSDEQLRALYNDCAFTVFPSLEEGFGLPILESLWYGKPCVCADFGAMAEVAKGGGCLEVDTRDASAVQDALARLIGDTNLRRKLAQEASERLPSTWHDYAKTLMGHIDPGNGPREKLGLVYYWVDGTRELTANTGIQRVTRQLARSMHGIDLRLIPVKWGGSQQPISPASEQDLQHISRWGGPGVEHWAPWVPLEEAPEGSWFVMPELPLSLLNQERKNLVETAAQAGLRTCAIFYDTIPWKMRSVYPGPFATAYKDYMLGLYDYDLVLAISDYSRSDLVSFLGANLRSPKLVDDKIHAVPLPGEIPGTPRGGERVAHSKDSVSILAVGTVEPRKNHDVLLEAFSRAEKRTTKSLELVLVGGDHSIDPTLPSRVLTIVEANPRISWVQEPDDKRVRQLYSASDFTVYASVEEGVGLPILESLWNGKPSICANFGEMVKTAEGGGCLTVDVTDADVLADAIVSLAEDSELLRRLSGEAVARTFKSWRDYAVDVASRMAERPPKSGCPPSDETGFNNRLTELRLAPRPKLSVCISTYNRADWLKASLENWQRLYPAPLDGVELVVCDNASSDHTSSVVEPYMARPDISYRRNRKNVGMLGNLRETAHIANGDYIWILGDDDLIVPGSVERVLKAINSQPEVALVYLNYAFTRIADSRTIRDFEKFIRDAEPIVPPEPDQFGQIRQICARNENFFTAIYTLVLRRDHAIGAYSQNTAGRPFSTMLTCIPTTYYVLNNMMDEHGVWIGTPQVVVNMNVSWMRYAPLWILERIPELYDLAERRGVDPEDMDRWRRHTLPSVLHYFRTIYGPDPEGNSVFFSPDRLVRRFLHLPEFSTYEGELLEIYEAAREAGHPAARLPVEEVFPRFVTA